MFKDFKNLLIGIIFVIIGVVIIIALVGRDKTSDVQINDSFSISEAQAKCMLMEEADLVNLNGEPFNNSTIKKAEQTCLSQWDMTKNPDNTEDKFKEIIKSDWETRKTETIEGTTLENLYIESTK